MAGMRRIEKTALFLVLLLLGLAPDRVVGQSTNADSLLNILLAPRPLNRLDVTPNAAHIFFYNLPLQTADSIIAFNIAKEKDAFKLSKLFLLRAALYAAKSKMAENLSFLKKALEFAETSGDQIQVADVNWSLGCTYRELGFYSHSSEHLLIAAKIASHNDFYLAAISFYEAAITSYRVQNTQQSLQEQRLSLWYMKKIGLQNLDDDFKFYSMSGLNTMGLNHQRLKQYDSALWYFAAADSAARVEVKNKWWDEIFWKALILGNMGSAYLELGKPEKALQLFREEYESMKSQNNRHASVSSGLNLVTANLQLGRIDTALRLMNEIKGPDAEKRPEYWQVNAKVQEASGNLSEAINSVRKMIEMGDSSRVETDAVHISALKMIYDVAAMDENIRQLTDENNQKQSLIELQIIAFSLCLIMLLVMVAVFYRFNKKSKGQLRIIHAQNEEMAQQNLALREALDKLSDTQNQLIESAKMSSLGQMTAGLAHEINNPLNYISGGIQALDHSIKELVSISVKDKENEVEEIERDIYGMLKTIHNGVGRATRIVQSLRTFSSKHPDFAEIQVTDAIEMAIDILLGRIKSAEIQIHRDYSSQTPAIFGNLSELSQVISNLIDNAIHAMHNSNKKELTIQTRVEERSVVIRICDTGAGIPEDIQNKIFEPFFTTKETGSGTGLGLSISYGIIKKHRGDLTFISDAGGSCFTVTLPKGI
jgi:two-component system, NtrC family, sensor kinase